MRKPKDTCLINRWPPGALGNDNSVKIVQASLFEPSSAGQGLGLSGAI